MGSYTKRQRNMICIYTISFAIVYMQIALKYGNSSLLLNLDVVYPYIGPLSV